MLDVPLSGSALDYYRARIAMHTHDTYKGRIMAKFPEDLRTYEHLIWETQPEVIVELGTFAGGSALWFADRLQTLCDGGTVITVDISPAAAFNDARIVHLVGDISDKSVVDHVHSLCAGRRVMVTEDSAHTYAVTSAALANYSDLVAPGCWMVVEDGVVDVPDLRIPGWPSGVLPAIDDFMRTELAARFERHDLRPYGLTTHPTGWLRAKESVDAP